MECPRYAQPLSSIIQPPASKSVTVKSQHTSLLQFEKKVNLHTGALLPVWISLAAALNHASVKG